MKFLGVKEDNQLWFNKHVEVLTEKGMKKENIMRCQETKYWRNSWETQRKLYIQYVRNTLE